MTTDRTPDVVFSTTIITRERSKPVEAFTTPVGTRNQTEDRTEPNNPPIRHKDIPMETG